MDNQIMRSEVLIAAGLGFLDLIYESGSTGGLSEIFLEGSLPLRSYEVCTLS